VLYQLNAIHPLSAKLWERLSDVLEQTAVKKNKYLYRPGQVANCFYFVESGLIRRYNRFGKREITSAFCKEGNILVSLNIFYPRIRANEYYKAVENSRVWFLSYKDLQTICEAFPEFNFHLRELIGRNAQLNEECLHVIRSERGNGRYEWLKERLPDLVQRVPAKYLASYIGITEVALSRIKAGKE
jgi:CRP-like cAMP-binding protein